MPLLCGIDWATEHHDFAVIDVDGRVVARGRVSDDAGGFAQLAQTGDSARASGKNTVALHRHIKNRRLAAVGPI